jgi:hypothetical protein
MRVRFGAMKQSIKPVHTPYAPTTTRAVDPVHPEAVAELSVRISTGTMPKIRSRVEETALRIV